MASLLESYRVLGVKAGADFASVTTSYKQLCREYHPDISDNPEAEELMKQVNIAYTVLREKFKRDSAFRERVTGARSGTREAYPRTPTSRRDATGRARTETSFTWKAAQDPQRQAALQYHRKAAEQAAVSAEAESSSRKLLHDYFKALNTFDYKKAYSFLSEYDKSNITLEAFTQWREAVCKLYSMREFQISTRSSVAVVTWGGSQIFHARKFRVLVTENDYTLRRTEREQSGEHDKLVIIENGHWRVFLGYKEVSELTRAFERRFERKKKRDIEARWEEYAAEIDAEYDMLNIAGLRRVALKELYRQRRYGSSLTFAAVSVGFCEDKSAGLGELLRGAARTISGELREIDVAAYAGDGVFVVMFVELGKKNAKAVVSRLVDTIRKNADLVLGEGIQVDYAFESWSENRYADFDEINSVLGRFGKKV